MSPNCDHKSFNNTNNITEVSQSVFNDDEDDIVTRPAGWVVSGHSVATTRKCQTEYTVFVFVFVFVFE